MDRSSYSENGFYSVKHIPKSKKKRMKRHHLWVLVWLFLLREKKERSNMGHAAFLTANKNILFILSPWKGKI